MSTPPAALRIARARKRGEKSAISERRLRRLAHGRKEFQHRAKNGINDPMTHFHITDALLAKDGETFHTRDLVQELSTTRPQLAWDVTTVGKVVNDLAESLSSANGRPYISTARRWDGTIYAVEQTEECKAVLLRLLDDLFDLCEELLALERQGKAPKRKDSPLQRCPSVV